MSYYDDHRGTTPIGPSASFRRIAIYRTRLLEFLTGSGIQRHPPTDRGRSGIGGVFQSPGPRADSDALTAAFHRCRVDSAARARVADIGAAAQIRASRQGTNGR